MQNIQKIVILLSLCSFLVFSNEAIIYEDYCDSMNFCTYTVKSGQGLYIINYLKIKLYGLGSSQTYNEFVELVGSEIRWRHPDETISRVILETCHQLDQYRTIPIAPKVQLSILIYQMSEEYFSQFKTDFNATLNFLNFLSTDTISKTYSINAGSGSLNGNIMSSSWGAFQFEAMLYNAKKQRKIVSQKEILLPPVTNTEGLNYSTETSTVYRDSSMGADKESSGITINVGSININGNPRFLNKNNSPMTVNLGSISILFSIPVNEKNIHENNGEKSNILVKTKSLFINSLDLKDRTPNVVVAEISQENLLFGGRVNILSNDKINMNQQDKFLIVFRADILDPDYLFENYQNENDLQNLIKPHEDDVELTDIGLEMLDQAENIQKDLEKLFLSINTISLNEIISSDRLKKMALQFSPEHLKKDFAKYWVDIEFRRARGFSGKNLKITKRIEHLTIVPFKIGNLLNTLGIAPLSFPNEGQEKNIIIDVKILLDNVVHNFSGKDFPRGVEFKLYYIPSAAGGTMELIEGSKKIIYNRFTYSDNNNWGRHEGN